LRVQAQWLEANGEWERAVEAWLTALERDPGNLYSYRRAWQCGSRLESARRRNLWDRLEPRLLNTPGHLYIARDGMMLIGQRFGVAAAEQIISKWTDARPNDPDVTEAVVDLLLEHGHGRSDAERALNILKPAVQSFPYHLGLRYSLADALRNLGRFEEAEKVL